MSLQSRLETMKKYREQAMKKPKLNKLYIEDLDLSIAMFEKQIANGKDGYLIQSGWLDNEDATV